METSERTNTACGPETPRRRVGTFTLLSIWINRPDSNIRYTEEMITIG